MQKFPLFCLICFLLKMSDILARFGRFLGREEWIKLIPFHERPVSQDTGFEYQQQSNQSNLKSTFIDSNMFCIPTL